MGAGWLFALGGVGILLLASRSSAATQEELVLPSGTFDFPFMDERYLAAGQVDGGRVEVPAGATGPLPLLVWLHGNNDSAVLHRGMGGDKGGNDVRTMAPPGWMVAAPSQTKNAKGPTLWAGFDLDAFVSAVEQATGREVDRSRVVFAGHSGAGCTSGGGLQIKYGAVVPSKLVVVDTCLNPFFGSMLAELSSRVPVEVYYQPFTWARDFAGFERALGGRGKVERITGPFTGNAHEQIVPLALGRALA